MHTPVCFNVNGPGEFPGEPGPVLRDSGGQLPLAEHAGISITCRGLGIRTGRQSKTYNQQQLHALTTYSRACFTHWLFQHGRARVGHLDPGRVGVARDRDDLLVVVPRLGLSPDFSAAFAAPT